MQTKSVAVDEMVARVGLEQKAQINSSVLSGGQKEAIGRNCTDLGKIVDDPSGNRAVEGLGSQSVEVDAQ
jgi:ABC-type ATPase involved in cell division